MEKTILTSINLEETHKVRMERLIPKKTGLYDELYDALIKEYAGCFFCCRFFFQG